MRKQECSHRGVTQTFIHQEPEFLVAQAKVCLNCPVSDQVTTVQKKALISWLEIVFLYPTVLR